MTNLFYKEYQPSAILKPYVIGYWSLHTDGSSIETTPMQRCFPAGTIEWITQIRGNNMVGFKEEERFIYPNSIFTGVCNKSAVWHGYGNSEIFGVRFTPESAIKLFNTPLKEYHNSFLNSEDFLPNKIKHIISSLRSTETVNERIAIVESFLQNQLKQVSFQQNYFTEALKLIRQNNELNIASISKQVYVGERQLQRQFQSLLGISPKGYSRVVRLYKAHQQGLIQQDSYTNIAYQYGYADAAHFTRDFKDYFGVTPEHHFASINLQWIA